ncbi:MAG: YitT family protein [Thermacetogeniaceae bacterium]
MAGFSWRAVKKRVLPFIVRLLAISVGAVILAFSYNALVIPNGLLSGGITGIALIGNYLLGIPFYMCVMVLNIPVFLFGLKELSWKFIIYSLIGTAAMVIALPLIKPYTPTPKLDLFLAAVFSGAIGGIGEGIILKYGASTGGTDILSIIAKKRWNISVGAFSFYCNLVVILASFFLFDPKIALYTIVSVWVGGKSVDMVIEGLNSNKSVMIISEQSGEIADRIMNEVSRGVTFLEGRGAYSGDPKKVINCVVNHYEIPRVKEIVLDVDPKAFMFVTETVEVSGKGFSLPSNG